MSHRCFLKLLVMVGPLKMLQSLRMRPLQNGMLPAFMLKIAEDWPNQPDQPLALCRMTPQGIKRFFASKTLKWFL